MPPKYSRLGLALTAAPLYAGPLVAGWSAAPLSVVLSLVSIFFIMQLMAGKTADRGSIMLPLFVLFLAIAQVLVVVVTYGLGSLISLIVALPPVPTWLPLALSSAGAAIWVSRYRRTPESVEMVKSLDAAIAAIEEAKPVDDPDNDAGAASENAAEPRDGKDA